MKQRKNTRKKRNGNKSALLWLLFVFVVGCIGFGGYKVYSNIAEEKRVELEEEQKRLEEEEKKRLEEEEKNKIVKREIVITAAGDCTLGTDTKFSQATSLPTALKNVGNDYTHLMRNVYDIFKNDDYTIVNLENPFTDATTKKDKGEGTVFHFKGPKEYVNILTSSSIEGVTIANNHIYDYGKQGFEDTVNTLKENSVDFCGEGYKILKDVKGIKVGFLGYQGWSNTESLRNTIKNDIAELREKGASIVIPYFHWGIERAYEPYDVQQALARFAIDNGADMVLGSHPHVIQSLENYKGKMIAYSLGNFSFGGNSNPSDKRTFIIQMKFSLENEKVVNTEYKVIPTSISSVDYKNDYVPTPMTGASKDALLKELNRLSKTLNGRIQDEFFSIE